MDCSTREPKVLLKVISTNQNDIWGIQVAQEEGLVLVIAAPRSEGLHAYNAKSGVLKWSVVNKLPGLNRQIWPCGMAIYRKSRLFLSDTCDGNNCISMFRVTDGKYQGCLIKKGKEGLGDIGNIVWNEADQLLSVVHGKGYKSVAVIKVN